MSLLKHFKKRWKEETSFKPYVYRVKCEMPVFGKMHFEQMESKRQARLYRKIYDSFPSMRCRLTKEKPDKFQKWERKRFKKLTAFLEHFTAG